MSVQAEAKPNVDSIMNDPGFVNAFKMLLWKDFKQQTVRRPVSTCCRILLPVAFILLLGLIRVSYDTLEYDDTIYNPFKNSFASVQTNRDVWPLNSIASINDMYTAESTDELLFYYSIKKELTCFENLIDDAPTLPA